MTDNILTVVVFVLLFGAIIGLSELFMALSVAAAIPAYLLYEKVV